MKTKIIFISTLLFLWMGLGKVYSQYLNKAEVKEFFKTSPSFSIYKDNYLISGVPLNTDIDKNTADVKYQVSVRQVVTPSALPFNTHLVASYTQKSFWNIWANSSPFEEINFNPAVGLYKPVFNKKDEVAGMMSLTFEHQSNGRDSIYSRSWNSLNYSYIARLGEKTLLRSEIWLPMAYKSDNPRLLDYVGLFNLKLMHDFIPNKLSTEVRFRKGLKFNGNGSLRTRIYYNPFGRTQQYLMLEWYMGHAENLLDYMEFRNRIRLGFVIKTDELKFLKMRSKQKQPEPKEGLD